MAVPTGRLRERFARLFGGGQAPRFAHSPGRVNLIGEHTDYNEGYVLPMAIERGVTIAFAPRADRRIRVHSEAFAETGEFALDGLAPPAAPRTEAPRRAAWASYVAGVAWALEQAGHRLAGADLALGGDLVIGAGLSSSAALELAAARAMCAVSEIEWNPVVMATLAQKAENEFVGVACGLMDQLASALATEGCALLLDCRSLQTESVPLPARAAFVVMDTGVRRSLSRSGYNERRRSCEAAVKALQAIDPSVRALRDVDQDLLESGRDRLDPLTFRRAAHVVAENRRPPALADALRRHDLAVAGRLMDDSHASLRDLYDVSSPELDRVAQIARGIPGCFGARMTGAGFGGCAVALIDAGVLESFLEHAGSACREHVNPEGQVFLARASHGTRLLDSIL